MGLYNESSDNWCCDLLKFFIIIIFWIFSMREKADVMKKTGKNI